MFNRLKKQSFNNTSRSDMNCNTKFKNIDEFNLSSPSPFKNELKKFNILYIILSIVFIAIAKEDFGIIFSILIGICGSFVIINIIAAFKIDKLRNMEFNLSTLISKEQLTDIITLPLTQLNMQVENLPHYIRITHNKFQYDIIINQNRNTFRIWPQKTFLSMLFAKVYTKLYKNTIISMPIISYTIQSQINKSNNTM